MVSYVINGMGTRWFHMSEMVLGMQETFIQIYVARRFTTDLFTFFWSFPLELLCAMLRLSKPVQAKKCKEAGGEQS